MADSGKKSTLTRVVIITAAVAVVSLGIAAIIGVGAGGFGTRLLAGSATPGPGGLRIDERQSIPLDAVDQLAISSVSEDVRIVDGQSASAEAWLHGTVGTTRRELVPRLAASRNGSTAEITLERDRTLAIGPFWSNLVLEVSVPKGYAKSLSAKAVSASIDVGDHAYDGLSLTTTSGDVRVGAVRAGEMTLHTTSGRLSIREAAARRAELSSVSGDVSAAALRGDTSVHTTSGDVTLAFSAVPARIDATSTSGRLTLRFPAAAAFALEAHSTSGDISCAFPLTISRSQSGHHELQGVVQGGASLVSARTTSGDIRIEK